MAFYCMNRMFPDTPKKPENSSLAYTFFVIYKMSQEQHREESSHIQWAPWHQLSVEALIIMAYSSIETELSKQSMVFSKLCLMNTADET